MVTSRLLTCLQYCGAFLCHPNSLAPTLWLLLPSKLPSLLPLLALPGGHSVQPSADSLQGPRWPNGEAPNEGVGARGETGAGSAQVKSSFALCLSVLVLSAHHFSTAKGKTGEKKGEFFFFEIESDVVFLFLFFQLLVVCRRALRSWRRM